jgi:seryl-tRNA synthetase
MGEEATTVSETADREPAQPPAIEEGTHKDPETIRQEIEATKDRISDSVEALAEIKADIDYAKSHPKEVVKEKVKGAKDDMVARIAERKDEIMARRKTSGAGGGPGAKETIEKAKAKIAEAYETLETKLDELLGVAVSEGIPAPAPGEAGPPKPPIP